MVLQAYKKVRANKGSGGVDGIDWEWLDNNLKTELYKLWNRLTSGSYFTHNIIDFLVFVKASPFPCP